MKKHFTTGIVLLLPLILTALIVLFIINFLTSPFLEQAKWMIQKAGLFQNTNEADHVLLILTSKLLILFLLLAFILLMGILGKHLIRNHLFQFGIRYIDQIPYVSKIYHASKDVIQCLLSPSAATFTKVVYLPFPQKGKLSLGLVTCESVKIEFPDKKNEEYLSVFVPGTPNPTGCLLLVKKSETILTDMHADEAMRFVVSLGMTFSERIALSRAHPAVLKKP